MLGSTQALSNGCTGELTAHDDFLVTRSGPAGQKAAIQAAKLGNKVGIIEREEVIGGVCIKTGTIPSQSLRDAGVHPTGFCHRGLSGAPAPDPRDTWHHDGGHGLPGQPSDCDVTGAHCTDAWRLGGERCRVGLPSKGPPSR